MADDYDKLNQLGKKLQREAKGISAAIKRLADRLRRQRASEAKPKGRKKTKRKKTKKI